MQQKKEQGEWTTGRSELGEMEGAQQNSAVDWRLLVTLQYPKDQTRKDWGPVPGSPAAKRHTGSHEGWHHLLVTCQAVPVPETRHNSWEGNNHCSPWAKGESATVSRVQQIHLVISCHGRVPRHCWRKCSWREAACVKKPSKSKKMSWEGHACDVVGRGLKALLIWGD